MSAELAKDQGTPVSRERVSVCLSSAAFWVDELPRYADRLQQRADAWAIAAGLLAAITSLSIFPVLTDESTTLAKAVISGIALLAAVCALVPRVKNYAELAGQARALSSRYGSVLGDLMDLANAPSLDQEHARVVVTQFQAIKESKDTLRGLTDRAAVEIQQSEMDRRLADAHRLTAEAQRSAADARREADLAGTGATNN